MGINRRSKRGTRTFLGKFNVNEFPYQADAGFVHHRGIERFELTHRDRYELRSVDEKPAARSLAQDARAATALNDQQLFDSG